MTLETDIAYANRIAELIMKRNPEPKMKKRLKPGLYAEWATEGFAIAESSVYPSLLSRFQMPSEQYRKQAYNIAEPAIALAGYRLAAMLNMHFGK